MTVTDSPRKPSPWLVGAAVLFVLAVVSVGASELVSEVFHGSETKDSVQVAEAPRLSVSAGPGDVTLVPSPDADVHVRTVTRFGVHKPVLTEESTAAGVALASECHGIWAASRCETDYTIAVPAGFTVVVESSSGDLDARDLTGPLSVDASSGDIALAGLSGAITASTGSGNITGTGLRSTAVSSETNSGDVSLDLLAAPTRITASTGSGDIDLGVPADRAYRVATSSGSGRERVTVPSDPAGTAAITATANSGDITVHPS
ncbi:MAG: DUF4097 domain-containing protein [Pseudonocardia sp.]|nr:DUF4097 domain-containing protein [Pseudonocardia sp.]